MRRLASGLARRGLNVFFDEWDVLPGDVVVHRTDAAISDAACALVVVSPASATSPRALEEYAALAAAGATRNLRFIPVLIGGAVLPPFAANRVWRDFGNVDEREYEDRVEELFAVIADETACRTPHGQGAQVRRENVAAALPSPPRPVTEPDQRAFVVCYAPADAAYGLALADQLRAAALPVWSAADLRPGDLSAYLETQPIARLEELLRNVRNLHQDTGIDGRARPSLAKGDAREDAQDLQGEAT
ncbi:hypothetical protein GCM10018793_24200 [Streptomyces sulfonofaciens]|uniref:TIR domain-containing protein n=1 Tax=Streptomyces sulfonofaciens TaxID=68272 RepID=A0A919KYP9_9ACTN|nr:hypothetical protein GCM10018793_24200 [Streptomyces sulfonofaciens]